MTNRYAFHAPPEAIWRPCLICQKDTVGICYCGGAYCHDHQAKHETGCKVAKEEHDGNDS